MRRFAVLAALALLGCDQMRTEGETEDIASDAAQDAMRPVEARLDEVERRLDAIERIERAEGNYSSAIHHALDEERVNRRREIGALRDHYNEHLKGHR